jgi:hypothetical protein
MVMNRIVELAKDGVHDTEELSRRTLSSLNRACHWSERPLQTARGRSPGRAQIS